jgi:CRISPR/Cas system-associated endoribonuclease Cas2
LLDELKDENLTRQFLLNLLILRLRILIEKGSADTLESDKLLLQIKESLQYSVFTVKELDEFKLLEIRLRFTRFSEQKADIIIGNELCKDLIQSSDIAVRVQAEFYSIKLIPSVQLNPARNNWSAHTANEVYRKYHEILIVLRQLPEMKEILRQVLNDFAGSFLSDKILASISSPEDQTDGFANATSFIQSVGIRDKNTLAELIERLFRERLSLEFGVADPLSLKNQEQLLEDDSVLTDKRGLCYTLNYRTRAFYYTGNDKEAIEQGLVAFEFNKLVGDLTGCCVGSGFIAKAYERMQDSVKAFEWFEKYFIFLFAFGKKKRDFEI